MMCMRMCMLSMAMVSMWMIAICHSDLFVFLNVSSACNPLTCSARGCCGVGGGSTPAGLESNCCCVGG